MHITVTSGGKAIRVEGTEPAVRGSHPALVLLHGAGGNLDFWLQRIAPFAAGLGLAIYAVHYFDRTGTTGADPAMLTGGSHVPLWIDAIRDAIAAISARPVVDAGRVALVGISLGAFLSLALAAEGLHVRAIVEISGGLVPPYEAKATRTFPPVLIVHGDRDTVVPVAMAHALKRRLAELGVAHRMELMAGEGHWFSATAQASILAAMATFLRERL